jgi:hypothetical protein
MISCRCSGGVQESAVGLHIAASASSVGPILSNVTNLLHIKLFQSTPQRLLIKIK